MKTVILAGGYGTRLSEETEIRPKPMVMIGEKPMLWHIMKIYSRFGFNEFVILLGYKGYYIKEYFVNYLLHESDLTIDILKNHVTIHDNQAEPWNVTLLDTGMDTMTGGRLKRAEKYLRDERFMLTYGDGVADIDLDRLLEFHKSHGKLVTMTAVQPEGRFGAVVINDRGSVSEFREKPAGDGAWINGGFFICEPGIFRYLRDGDATILERAPLEKLATDGQLMAYRHEGFWKSMDTLRDKLALDTLWKNNLAKWKTWK